MSLERVAIPNNVLDRLDRLENKVRELMADSITPQAAPGAGDDAASTLSGWVIDGGVLRDAASLIVLDPSVPGIQIAAGGRIYSSDYVAGTSGFNINGGTAEFNDVVIRGTIYATVGEIGGWTIGAADLTGGDATLNSAGYLLLGTLNDIVRIDAADANYRLWIGHAVPGAAPFRVTKTGDLTATSAYIVGTIDANAGTIGSLTVDGLLEVGAVPPVIQIDGPNKRIRSSDYSAGISGWNIDTSGAEFANVRVRGSIQASIFEKSVITAVGGSWVVSKSAGVISPALVIDNGAVPFANTAHLIVKDPPGGGWLFETNDIIRIKAVYSGGVADTWGTVTRTATTNEYDITINNGTVNYTVPAGTGCVDYGASGQGFFAVSADGTLGASAAWVLGTHAGSPWTTTTAQVYAGTDGKLYAGAGAVYLDSNGITIVSGLDEDLNSLKWYLAGNPNGFIQSYTGWMIIEQNTTGGTGHNSVELVAGSSSPHKARFMVSNYMGFISCLDSDEDATQMYQWWKAAGSGGSTVWTHLAYLDQAGDMRLLGGLYVGSLGTDPAAGDVWVATDVRVGGGLYVGSLATDPGADQLIVDGTGEFKSEVVTQNVYCALYTINDDAVASFTPASSEGVVLLNSRTSGIQTINGLVVYRTAATVFTTAMVAGANLNVTTGVLDGTTGTDGKMTVSAHTDGKIYIENRMGGTAYVAVTLLGS